MPPAEGELIQALVDLTGASAKELKAILQVPWRYYRSTRVPKKDGTFRRIRAPSELLKRIQRAILDRRLKALDTHSANHCRQNHSVITNAMAHIHHRCVAAYDIHDAFPSTRPSTVRDALLEQGLGPVHALAITSICTLKRELPQGAPTSPAILSLVLRPLDEILTRESERHGLTYTRYMDDLFISGGRRVGEFERLLRQSVSRVGYRLAEGKVRHWGPRSSPTLAGIVLGTSMSPTPEFMRSVNGIVNRVERGELLLDAPLMAKLEGMIAWVRALSPRQGSLLLNRLRAASATRSDS